MSDKIKTNKYGRMWIETKDFLSDDKVRRMIIKLKNSNLVKSIDNRS